MNQRLSRLLRYSSVLLDLLSLNLLVIFLQLQMSRINAAYSLEYGHFWLWLNLSWAAVSWVASLYHPRYILSFEHFGRRTVHAYFYWLVVIMAYLFFTRQLGLSRVFIASVLVSFGIMLLVNRFLYLCVRYYLRQSPDTMRRVLIIGYNPTAKKLARYLEADGRYTEVVGFCEEESKVRELTHYPVVSTIENAVMASQLYGVQEIYSTISPEQNRSIYKLIDSADQACVRFRIIPDLQSFVNRSYRVNFLEDMPVLSLRNAQVDDPGHIIRKRLFDLAVSFGVILFILSWLVPLVALLIWLESPGPVFFKQQRTGKNNQPFWCLKFRSMKVNGDAHNRQASRDDDRFTRIGRFLRKTSLDEFPQFINVFKGDMSIVGPRPHMLKHTDDYSRVINEYMVRQFLKPGITGWAQVHGFRGETRTLEQMKKRVEYDLWYLEHWSLWLDVRIIFLTVLTTIKGDENAF